MGQPKDQAQRRRSYNPVDQFGRKWLVSVEILTGDVTGQASPCFDTLGEVIPNKYIRLDPDNPMRIQIRFDEWRSDEAVAENDWMEQLHVVGHNLYGEQYDDEKPPTERILRLVGKRPKGPAWVEALEERLTAEVQQAIAPRRGRPMPQEMDEPAEALVGGSPRTATGRFQRGRK